MRLVHFTCDQTPSIHHQLVEEKGTMSSNPTGPRGKSLGNGNSPWPIATAGMGRVILMHTTKEREIWPWSDDVGHTKQARLATCVQL